METLTKLHTDRVTHSQRDRQTDKETVREPVKSTNSSDAEVSLAGSSALCLLV